MTSNRGESIDFQPGTCVNCGSRNVTVKTPLYCSPQCRQAAELVRYVRARRKEGRENDPEIAEVIQTRMAMVLGGGYPEQQRRVSEDVRRFVFERANSRCQACGRLLLFGPTPEDGDSLATIQHVSGSSNNPDNLLAFCRRCNLDDAQSRFVPVELGSVEAEYANGLKSRWMSTVPLRICDDDVHWNENWRALSKEAKETLVTDAEVLDAADDTDLPGFSGWTSQGTPIQDY